MATNKEDNNIITFGKHKNKTWGQVFSEEPTYCRWVENTMPTLYEFWLFQKYVIMRNCQRDKAAHQGRPNTAPSNGQILSKAPSNRNDDSGGGGDISRCLRCTLPLDVWGVCEGCNKTQAAKNLQELASPTNYQKNSQKCYKCGKYGHYARDCYSGTQRYY